jgi:nicotinate-nucleotide pyrophosphorylase (carboxylating)
MTTEQFIDLALQEDLGTGDVTSIACIPNGVNGKAKIVAKENGIIAGLEYIRAIGSKLDSDMAFALHCKDGDAVKIGDCIAEFQGDGKALLSAERLILNIMQRMSGIATYTHSMVDLIAHTNATLLDTRKTTPLFRPYEKQAVKIGGGANHRIGLYDMILIKENHIELAGGIESAILKAKHYRLANNPDLKVEIELKNLEEVTQALICGSVNRVMLDNFSLADMAAAVKLINGKFEVEASGGVTHKTIVAIAETGVDYISVGALTHSIKSLDLSMLVDLN